MSTNASKSVAETESDNFPEVLELKKYKFEIPVAPILEPNTRSWPLLMYDQSDSFRSLSNKDNLLFPPIPQNVKMPIFFVGIFNLKETS